jgi:MoaA/NifB/PqqE/SkfB family radical SAM enzyme
MYYSDIENLHVELTNRCNAGCPSCVRTGDFPGFVSETIFNSGIHDLSLNDMKNICEQLPKLKWIHMCGNLGDPAVSPEFKEIVHYLNSKNIYCTISTNGAPRKPEYWKEIALKGVSVSFHIDGDEDTNHLYRIGTNYYKIIDNAKAFIKAGGHARWVFIPFKHNEHVIEKCKNLAKHLGFKEFNVKKSYRVTNLSPKAKIKIELPKNENLINFGATNNKGDKCISCKVSNNNEIYFSCNGEIYPCCWWAGYFWSKKFSNKENKFSYLLDFENNFKKRDIKDIVNDYIKKTDVYKLVWDLKKFSVCNKKCGNDKHKDRYVESRKKL